MSFNKIPIFSVSTSQPPTDINEQVNNIDVSDEMHMFLAKPKNKVTLINVNFFHTKLDFQ